MAKVTIGGEAIAVDLPNFKKLKAAWGYIAAVQGLTAGNMLAGVDSILSLIAVGSTKDALSEEQVAALVDGYEEAMTPREMLALRPFMNDLLVELGLATPPGEDKPAAGIEATPSTATSTS